MTIEPLARATPGPIASISADSVFHAEFELIDPDLGTKALMAELRDRVIELLLRKDLIPVGQMGRANVIDRDGQSWLTVDIPVTTVKERLEAIGW